MPSGAKKRKAAKKKKELQGNHQSNSHGEEDLKHDEDKLEDGFENVHITIEHDESGKEPPKKGFRRSSSSSSSCSSNSSSSEEKSSVEAMKEKLDEKLGSLDEKATVSEVLVELEKRIDEASAVLHDGAVQASDAKASAVKEDEDKLELSYNAPTVDVSVHPDNGKDTPSRECCEHQPVALAPRPAQTTSWKSCCGLFEVFSG